jgi:hypothetical protein
MSKRLLPLVPDGLSVLQVLSGPDSLTIVTAPRLMPVVCPVCQTPSHRPHGFYERILADLPYALGVRPLVRALFARDVLTLRLALRSADQ